MREREKERGQEIEKKRKKIATNTLQYVSLVSRAVVRPISTASIHRRKTSQQICAVKVSVSEPHLGDLSKFPLVRCRPIVRTLEHEKHRHYVQQASFMMC